MPDNFESESKKVDSTPQMTQLQSIDPPSPPNDPNPSEAQHVGGDSEENQIKGLEDRIHRAELWMIGLTAAIALFALCSVVVGVLQWKTMSSQLKEMRDSGQSATSQTSQAIGNFNWMARVADGSLHQAQAESALNDLRSKAALDATIEQNRLDQRAWVGITVVEVPKPLPVGNAFEITNHYLNSGKTPAIRPHIVAEIGVGAPGNVPIYEESWASDEPPLLPGAELTTTVSRTISTNEALKSIMDGKVVVYDRGASWYWDIFGRKHVSIFCLAYHPASGSFHADPKIPCKKQKAD